MSVNLPAKRRRVLNILRSGVISILALFSSQAFAGSAFLDPARILYERPTPTIQRDLIACFVEGKCKEDDKIRIYPMPCNGSGAADCTGCYILERGSPMRIGDLNPAGNCSGVGSPTQPKLRVLLGYEQNCPGATSPGDSCDDGQLLLGCSVTSENDTGVDPAAMLRYNKECFSGNAFIRRVKGVAATVTITPTPAASDLSECPAGTTGAYPSCAPCSDTSYKPTGGTAACTACPLPTITHSTGVVASTAGTTKTSVNDCRVASITCENSYAPDLNNLTCEMGGGCNLEGIYVGNPTAPNYNNGTISVAATSSSRPFTYSVNPNAGTAALVTTAGTTEILSISDLSGGTYTITATDSAASPCSRSLTVGLVSPAPSPTPTPTITPSPSPTPPTVTITTPTPNPPGCLLGIDVFTIPPKYTEDTNGWAGVNSISGLVGTPSFSLTPEPKPGTQYSPTSFGWSGLAGNGSYTMTVSDSGVAGCTTTRLVTFSSPPRPPCPVMVLVSDTATGPGGLRTMTFRIDPNNFRPKEDSFSIVAYSTYLHVNSFSTDTPSTIAAEIAGQINAKTAAEWNTGAYGRAPPAGTPGFPPVATPSGPDIIIVLDYLDKFHISQSRYMDGCPYQPKMERW